MPFIPHTPEDVQAMLDAIGVTDVTELFDEIPPALRWSRVEGVPPGASEMAIGRLMRERAAKDGNDLCFLGAGAYEHHIPAAVWEITTRGEFYSAYTPYQAEASQGTLQLIYEYQSMMTALMDMDVSNASLYDGASALAEAALMALRLHRGDVRRIWMPAAVHPHYRETVRTIVEGQGIALIEVPYDPVTGQTQAMALDDLPDAAALVIPQPNFFGRLEEVDALTDAARARGALVIAVVNPLAMAVLKPPGAWGAAGGADIACGDGQPLGIPLAGGGPYYGFLCCRSEHVRQMPGRIVGRTVDRDGKTGYTLTLQPREQHIRRAKATSNICTNQGLMVTASTIHMALLGAEGLARAALSSHARATALAGQLAALPGVSLRFAGPFFHEFVLTLPRPVAPVLASLADVGILGGYDLSAAYPELGHALLVCATETRTAADLARYTATLSSILGDDA
ncbi:MAG TPA: aminomethyl-transferring glycine dehydrogenase subunit GcvPA [Candidatus Acidoferrales bacterium]|nr:aminomethyl-transferring glycine dehydrogenase subunit GcvPA [Candidatus Acidoferrales bacterium]